jgi:hypothetical protein
MPSLCSVTDNTDDPRSISHHCRAHPSLPVAASSQPQASPSIQSAPPSIQARASILATSYAASNLVAAKKTNQKAHGLETEDRKLQERKNEEKKEKTHWAGKERKIRRKKKEIQKCE